MGTSQQEAFARCRKEAKPYEVCFVYYCAAGRENDFFLGLPPYMGIYLVINAENLKLFEPSGLDEDVELLLVLPLVENIASDAQIELEEVVLL